MIPKPTPICVQHNTEKVWQQTVFEYSEDDISVQVQNVWAWVCPEDGEVKCHYLFRPQISKVKTSFYLSAEF